MTVETATYLNSLSSANPGSTDQIPEGDDHLRLIKAVLKSTFPGRGGEERRTIVKGAGYTPALTEIGSTFVHTATLAVALAALAGLPEGTFYNFTAQTGTTTLTPNGANTIDGVSTYVLTVGQSCEIVKQGTNWVVLAAPYTPPSTASQAEMEAGVLATIRAMSPLLVAQAIAKLAVAGPPVGTILDFGGGGAAPTNYLFCPLTSTLVATATYPALFAAIGYQWGGSGANFGLPYFPSGSAALQYGAIGAYTYGDVKSHTHSEMSGYTEYSGGIGYYVSGTGVWTGVGGTTGATGGSANLAAGMFVRKIVKYQ